MRPFFPEVQKPCYKKGFRQKLFPSQGESKQLQEPMHCKHSHGKVRNMNPYFPERFESAAFNVPVPEHCLRSVKDAHGDAYAKS